MLSIHNMGKIAWIKGCMDKTKKTEQEIKIAEQMRNQ